MPTASTPGFTTFRGRLTCVCMAEWLPFYEAELQRRDLLVGALRIYQLTGTAAASGGTHGEGGAADLVDLPGGDEEVWVARQMGADATWARKRNWDGRNGIEHLHCVLRGCPHNGPARYQIDAVDAGFNGLGRGGRGAPDPGPRPLSKRTWREGIEWAQAQEDDMKDSDFDRIEAIVEKAVEKKVRLVLDEPININAPGDKRFKGLSVRALLKRIATKTGAVG